MKLSKPYVFNLEANSPLRAGAIQGDTKSRFLELTLTASNKIVDLRNHTVRVYGVKKDGTEIFNDVEVKDAEGGKVELELTSQALACPGEVQCQLRIYGDDGSIITSGIFIVAVEKSLINDSSIESSNEYKSLDSALIQAKSAITKDDIQTAINNITIGGRNYLRNSGDFTDLTYWILSMGTDANGNKEAGIVEIVNDSTRGNVMHITKTNTVSYWVLENKALTLPSGLFTIGNTYTISMDVKAAITNTTMAIGFKDIDGTDVVAIDKPFILTTSWQRYSYTFTATIAGSAPVLYLTIPGGIGELFIDNAKLEIGNKATDWCPAIEDTDAKITTLSNQIAHAVTTVSSTATLLDATSSDLFILSQTSTNTITSISGGVNGREITLCATTSYTTIQNGTTIALKGAANATIASGGTLTLKYVSNKWWEISRSF